MMTPLLALRLAGVSGPRPAIKAIRIDFHFYPDTRRDWFLEDESTRPFVRLTSLGPTVLMMVYAFDRLEAPLQAEARRLAEELSKRVSQTTGASSNAVPGSSVNKEWSMDLDQFGAVVRLCTGLEGFEHEGPDAQGREVVTVRIAV